MNRYFLIYFCIYFIFIVKTLCIYVPENFDNNKISYDTFKVAVQEQEQQRHGYDINHLTVKNAQQLEKLKQQHEEEKSYDKINDVPTIYNDHIRENHLEHDEAKEIKKREKRQLGDLLIMPNTRWCGKGNIANDTYNHLGGASLADKCCRRHDSCSYFIPALSNRYDLFNYRPYTLSHCNCDRRFYTCLKLATDDADARTIGKLFFNVVQTNCFVLRSEKLCRKRDSNGDCVDEYSKQKAYIQKNRRF